MQIKFARSGGFAGAATSVAGTVEFDEHGARVNGDGTDYHRELTPQETEQLRAAAEPGALTAAKAALPAPEAVRDGYQYDITVVGDDGKSHSLTLGEGPNQPRNAASDLRSWIEEETQKIWRHRVGARK